MCTARRVSSTFEDLGGCANILPQEYTTLIKQSQVTAQTAASVLEGLQDRAAVEQ
jgi:hypothetical protein